MNSMISEGVLINVETYYQREYSRPLMHEYMYAYRITIENTNSFPVQLHGRKWIIFDSTEENYKEVEGQGVVGVEPVIPPGEEYQYVSGAMLRSDIGYMHGFYYMENLSNHQPLTIQIPMFHLIAPFKLN